MNRLNNVTGASIASGFMLAGALAGGMPVHAQESSERLLEEVLVTAQKRQQSLEEIPMSITVLSGDLLEDAQAFTFQDMVALVPGLSLTGSTPGVTRVTLRGINTGGVASTVGIYVGDVPFGSSTGLANGAIVSGDFDTFDMARVEVLRGPQGTLYGASSLGGVIKYVPNAPSTEGFEARAKVSLESVSGGGTNYAFTGLFNTPVNEQLAIRASGFYRADDGFIDSIGNNPIASLTDPNVNIIDGTLRQSDINTRDTYGGRLSALWTPTDDLSIDFTAMLQNIESGAPDTVDADPLTQRPLLEDVQSRYQEQYTDISYELFSATVDWDFGPANFQSVTSYGTFEQDFQVDSAIGAGLTGGPPLAGLVTLIFGDAETRPLSAVLDQITSTDKFTQEFRLISQQSDSFEWLAGVFYTDEDSVIDQAILAVEAGTETAAAGLPPLAVARVDSNYEEIALFANGTWYLTEQFELSLGARWSDNEQVASQVSDGPLAGGLTRFDDALSSETPFTWSVSPRYELNEHSSVYARIATGFRPGGPNILPPGAPPDVPTTYDSDELTSYEIGYKYSDPNGLFALDVAAYYLDWEDIQLFAVVNNFGVNANGGAAESKGFEFTTSLFPMDGLSLSLNGAYTDASLEQPTDPVIGGLDGDPLPYVPEWSFGLGADYDWDLGNGAIGRLGGNLGYVGKRYSNFSNRDANGIQREVDSYTTLNLRAGVDKGRWSIELYAKNLLDEEGVTSIDAGVNYPNGALGLGLIRPRTIGLSVGARF